MLNIFNFHSYFMLQLTTIFFFNNIKQIQYLKTSVMISYNIMNYDQ